ncbi:hypothetical protein T492DRAFT_1050037 [Pavlovales sp. CCMP2436]|nr:hypothetical protein T492DRAFT_1050037 [Pavlovales sp. CCMP2436]|mmetsp:Transcript_34186/g.85154  ORF Transcript_34186/g.85154 Transcript_34186/m.85154 type:complete len:132 (-) Transcript_34186:165-560(-)
MRVATAVCAAVLTSTAHALRCTPIWTSPVAGSRLMLFTKEGCTLCDKAVDVLEAQREAWPHSLDAVDIEAPGNEEFLLRYCYDIPVLHVDGRYWAKHRITASEAVAALTDAAAGKFEARRGEPDARKARPR